MCSRGALWTMGLVRCGIQATGLLTLSSDVVPGNIDKKLSAILQMEFSHVKILLRWMRAQHI